MAERFERHRQPWKQDEIQKLHLLAGKGMTPARHRQGADPKRGIGADPREGRQIEISKLRYV